MPISSSSEPRHFRADIQGLRALAVVLVIANHLVSKPTGGFVGVDVFFVVSGYVITGLLLREIDSTGRISLRSFYRRRIKRIMPAAVLVIAVTLGLGSVLFSAPREAQLQGDALWTVLFGANWRYVALGTDYLHATDTVSPLQHYWSLSVEEQFYVIWPLLVILALVIFKRRKRIALAATAGLLVAVSFGLALWESINAPTVAYFSTESRAWELGIGAVLACCAPLSRGLPLRFQTPLAWLGLAAIATSVVMLNTQSTFPAPGALLPVLGAAAILAAGERGPTADLFPLTNRVSNYVGNISYSLYLWHFPVLVFVGILHPQLGRAYVAFSLALTVGLAVLSYHFVESPLRRIRWVHRSTPAPRRRSSRRSAFGVAVLGVLVLVVAGGTFVTRSPERAAATSLASLRLQSTSTPEQAERSAAIDAALADTQWPALSPAIADLGPHLSPEWIKDGCLGYDNARLPDAMSNAAHCVYGDPAAPRTVAVLGDSVAISFVPGIRAALPRGWRIEVYTAQQCPAVDVDVRMGNGAPYSNCSTFRNAVRSHLEKSRPDLVVMTSSEDSPYRLVSRAAGQAAYDQWQTATSASLAAYTKIARKVVILDGPSPVAMLRECYTPLSRPADCATGVSQGSIAMHLAEQAAVKGVANASAPATTLWFCSREGVCPAYVGKTAQTEDGRHLLDLQARGLGPLIRQALLGS